MIIPRFSLLKCLCHCSSATDKVINFTERSWKTFKLAAETRQDEIYKKTFFGKQPSEISFPHDGYHRLCYQIYTSSSKLKRYSSSSINDLKEHTFSPQSKKPKTRLSVPNFSINCCLFCQGTKLIRKGASKRRVTAPLQKCLTNIAAKKILEAAKARKDETILHRIEGEDIIAMDTVYHKAYYATYTSKDHIRRVTTPKHIVEFGPYNLAFTAVRSKIKIEILQNNVIMPLSLLRDLFIKELKNNGVRNTECRLEKLKHRIENEFGELIGFYNPPDRTGYLLYKADKSQLVDMLDKIHNVVPEESTETISLWPMFNILEHRP